MTVFVSISAASLSYAEHQPATANLTRQEPAHIDLSRLGFTGLSLLPRLTDDASFTVHFVDNKRLLVTYNRRALLTRSRNCQPSHEDRVIHAAVLRIPDGRALHEADWYVHDRRRYVWSLGGGKFLFRNLSTLYELDARLEATSLLRFPDELLWVSAAQDGSEIVVERQEAPAVPVRRKANNGRLETPVRIDFFDSQSLAVNRMLRVDNPVELQSSPSGFADVARLRRDTWLVRFGPSAAVRRNVARVRSRCTPDVLYSGSSVLVIGRCSGSHGYAFSAYSTTGALLWKAHSKRYHVRPVIYTSADGSRFVLSSLIPPDEHISPDNDDEDPPAMFEQEVQVRDTATGTVVFAGSANSTILQQNVALSPDGSRLALLHGLKVDIYELPRMSEWELASYHAVQDNGWGSTVRANDLLANGVAATSVRTVLPGWGPNSASTVSIPLRRQDDHEALPQVEPD